MLEKLEKIDLKTIWENEAYNFTPWLAQKENLELLGEVIVIEIELKAQEKNVDPFRELIFYAKIQMMTAWF
jgi:hypothetical protein